MLEFHTLDVFTDMPFQGNPLAVVLGADGLTTAQMQTIAREFNLSETIFVQAPQNAAHTARVRIFFPTAEIPFAGHPTIGCAIHLACAAHPGDFTALITLEEQAGLVPVTVTRHGTDVQAEFTAPVIPHAAPGEAERALIAAAVGIDAAAIGYGTHLPGVWQGGPSYLIVPLASKAALLATAPREPYWSDLMAAAQTDSGYFYTPGPDCDYLTRMFSPTAGIPEDPATGSAAAIFAAHLLAAGALPDGTTALILRQGVQMGRASTIGLTVDVAAGHLTAVRIKGTAVPISLGRICIP